jgi:hypothetical protein
MISGGIDRELKPGTKVTIMEFGGVVSRALKRIVESGEVLEVMGEMIDGGHLVYEKETNKYRRVKRLP